MREFSELSDEKEFPNIRILTFLAKTTHAGAYYPNEYLYDFELRRITFTTLGTLKQRDSIDDHESKFLLSMFFVFRSLIRDILLNPQNVYRNQPLDNHSVQYCIYLILDCFDF